MAKKSWNFKKRQILFFETDFEAYGYHGFVMEYVYNGHTCEVINYRIVL